MKVAPSAGNNDAKKFAIAVEIATMMVEAAKQKAMFWREIGFAFQ